MLDKRRHSNAITVPTAAFADIEQYIKDLKRNKAGGCDGITNEHLMINDLAYYSPQALSPMIFVKGSLLKSRHSDATSPDKCRCITLSLVLSKVSEAVLLCTYNDLLTSDSIAWFSICTYYTLFTVDKSIK